MSMAFHAGATPADAARRVIDANSYLTLATANTAGQPWATPVWFAERDLREFVWVSRIETRHSANIAARSEVALAVFDSTVFNDRSVARGLRSWSDSDVTGSAPHRLFRALASQVWVLDENERRVVVA